MKKIVISSPIFFVDEAAIFQKLIENGVDYIHLRKPGMDIELIREVLLELPSSFHAKIKLHYYRDLLVEFPLLGFHHSSKTNFDNDLKKSQSKSFHLFEEIKGNEFPYEYCFLSPVFPSISKENYLPKYSFEEFRQFLCEHPQEKCIALGGVCENNIRQIQDLGFSGIALLGELWKEKTLDKIINKFVRINKLITP